MSTTFVRASLVLNTPWGVYVSIDGGPPIITQNALNQVIPEGSELLIARNGSKSTLVGRRFPDKPTR